MFVAPAPHIYVYVYEGDTGRDKNEIASYLLKLINVSFIHKKKHEPLVDNDKNNIMTIFLFLFLLANNVFDNINYQWT